MTANLAAVQARISSLEAQFASRFGARPAAASASTSFADTLATQQSGRVPNGAKLSVAMAPAPNDAWVRALPDAGKAWAGEINLAARRHGLDPRLLTALVQQESAFRPDAVSHAGAIGLGQLMPGTAAALGVDPNDPVQNLDGAAAYLREQLDRFGSVELALAAYNAGPGRVEDAGGIPNIAETQTYVVRVTSNYDHLVAASNSAASHPLGTA